MPAEMKAMIADTLIKILKKKTLDKITVKELVEMCHISRQAFYYHFQDILQVVEWYLEKTLSKAVEKSLSANNSRETVEILIQQVFQDKDLIQNLIESQYKADIHQLLVDMTSRFLQCILLRKSSRMNLSPVEVNNLIHFYSYGLVGVMLQDLKKKNPDKDALVKKICRILSGNFKISFIETEFD